MGPIRETSMLPALGNIGTDGSVTYSTFKVFEKEPPVGPSRDWKEIIPEGEPARLEGLAERLLAVQRRRAGGGKTSRALHAKGHGGVTAEFTILPELPPFARVGLFSQPATYKAYVRFSNGSGARQSDGKNDVRGLAIKVLGVTGKKIIPGLESAATQDFLLIHHMATPFKNAYDFIWFMEVMASRPALLLPLALLRFGPLGALAFIRKAVRQTSRPFVSFATSPFSSAGNSSLNVNRQLGSRPITGTPRNT